MIVYPRLGWIFLAVLVCAMQTGCRRAQVEGVQSAPPKVSVSHPVVRELVDEDDYTGWLRASATVDVRARVRGHIQKVSFQDGDMVERGQLLFELDPRPFQVAIDQSTAQVKVFEAQKNAADKDVARRRVLLRANAVSQEEFDKYEADALSYTARINAALQDLERDKLDLEFSRITAPISGRVGRAMLTEGNLVNAGGTDPVLTTIVAVDPVHVYFTIDERSLQRYMKAAGDAPKDAATQSLREKKMPFQFGLDTEKGYPHQGALDFADNKVDSGTGTIEVRGLVRNDKGFFVAGSRVRVRVPVSDKYSAVVAPDTAMNTDQDQKYLLIVGADKVVKRQNVRLGRLLDDGMRVILEPKLDGAAWIIVEGMERARLNYPVEPIPETVPTETPSAK